jgi:hypothetical protein
MSDAFEFFGDERIMGEIASFFREHGSRIRPEPLEAARAQPDAKPPSGICVTICETAAKLARGYFALMKDKGIEIEFESEEEIFSGSAGDSPDQLQDYFQRHKHKRIKLRIKP